MNKISFISSLHDFLTKQYQEVLEYNGRKQKVLFQFSLRFPMESFFSKTISTTTFKLSSVLGALKEEEKNVLYIYLREKISQTEISRDEMKTGKML